MIEDSARSDTKDRVVDYADTEIDRLQKSKRVHESNIEVNTRRLAAIQNEIDTYKKIKTLVISLKEKEGKESDNGTKK